MLPYLGEKSKFSNFIVPNIPTDISTYVEPFGGMFGTFFSMDITKYPNTKFIYNDINKLNFNIFNKIKDNDFTQKLISCEATEELYYEIQRNWTNNKWTDDEITIYWIILLCCSKSRYSILNGEWKNNYEFDVFKMKLKYYKHYVSMINNIHNIDYVELIDIYDSPSTFFYLDPPYVNKEHFYINHNFNNDSHYELSQILKSIEGRFALSYYNFPNMTDWYGDCRIIKNSGLLGTEYLILSF